MRAIRSALVSLTNSGRTLSVVSVLAVTGGLVMGQAELAVIGTVLGSAVLIALLLVRLRPNLEVRRRLRPEQINVGDEVVVELLVINSGGRTTRSASALDVADRVDVPVALPTVKPNGTAVVDYTLRPNRRGIFAIGPLRIGRSDPFGLTAGGDSHGEMSRLVVYPRSHVITPFPVGLTRDLDGPTSGLALEGGVTFHSLRPYVRGDDRRLVHWKSFARTGELMVRQNVETVQPRTLVVVDARAGSYASPGEFEVVLEAGASIVSSCVEHRFPCSVLFVGCSNETGSSSDSQDRDTLLAMLAGASLGGPEDIVEVVRGTLSRSSYLSLAVLSGNPDPSELASIGGIGEGVRYVTAVLTGSNVPIGVPGCTTVQAPDGPTFAAEWNRVVA